MSKYSHLIFFGVVTVVLVLLYILLTKRVISPLKLNVTQKRIVFWVFSALFAVQLVTPLLYRKWSAISDNTAVITFYWLSYAAMGFVTVLLFFAIVGDIGGWIAQLVSKFTGGAIAESPERREFFRHSLSLGMLGASTATTAIGLAQVARGPTVKTIKVPVKNLHPDLAGYRIAQISDVHIGPTLKRSFMQNVVDQVNGQNPDMIAVTGDLVDGTVDQLREHTDPLSQLKSKDGTYFVNGNHEYYWGVDQWNQYLTDIGMKVLKNEHAVIQRNQGKLLVAGVNDISAPRMRPDHPSDPVKAIAGAVPSDFKVLLAHQPKSVYGAIKAKFDLQLSGHTHAGQYWPYTWFVGLVHPVVKDLNWFRDKIWVYVNPGTGYWGPPMRVGTRSEVSIIELIPA